MKPHIFDNNFFGRIGLVVRDLQRAFTSHVIGISQEVH